MSVVSITAAKNAKPDQERSFQDQEASLPTNSIVMRVARALWPSKTDMALSHRTGTSDRMCRYWLSEKYKLSADDLAALLRSDEGFEYLTAIIGDSKPVWWRAFKRSVRRAELRRLHAQLARDIEENEQGELGI